MVTGCDAIGVNDRRQAGAQPIVVDDINEHIRNRPVAGVAGTAGGARVQPQHGTADFIPGDHVHVVHCDDVVAGVVNQISVSPAAIQSLFFTGEKDKAHRTLELVLAENVGGHHHSGRAAGVIVRTGSQAGGRHIIQVRRDQNDFAGLRRAGLLADHIAIRGATIRPVVVAHR